MLGRVPVVSRPVEIAPLHGDRAAEAGRVLAASHAEDPAFVSLFPDPGTRDAALRIVFGETVRDALPFGAIAVATVGGRIFGAAAWLPPGRFPLSFGRKLRGGVAFLALAARAPRALPPEPVWFLAGLGVDPTVQGRGIGGRLLEPALGRADREGVPCHLETWKRANVGFYERHGFRVVREVAPLWERGPVHRTMRRPAPGEAPPAGIDPGAAGGVR